MCEEIIKPFRVWIVWGDQASEIQKYEFETQAELDAFKFGVAESDGWLGSAAFDTEAEAIVKRMDRTNDGGDE